MSSPSVNAYLKSHLFWGESSPLSALTGLGILVLASGRVVFALVSAAALVWVNAMTMLCAGLGRQGFPREESGPALLFVSSFWVNVFCLLLWFFDPILTLESYFFILLCPIFHTGSGLYARVKEYDTLEMLSRAVSEALVLGALVLALSLIREPLGSGGISLPGLGLIRFFRVEPLRLLQVSSGALILLGYGIAAYRYFRNQYTNSEDD